MTEQSALPALVVGVAGGTGAGKTTISHTILERVGADRIAYIQHDSYYRDLGHLQLEERQGHNFDHPNSLENELLIEHLRALRHGNGVNVPTYDFRTYTRCQETVHLDPRPIILVEGILVFADRTLRDLMDIKIYVDADADVRLIRRLERDIVDRGRSFDSVISQYLNTVRPMHLEFVEPSKRYADVIVPEGGRNTVALDMICARINTLLARGE